MFPLKNVLGVLIGIFVGMVVNMGIIIIGSQIIPLPDGIDPTDPESVAQVMKDLPPKNFITPFLAHSIGTLVGALAAFTIATSHRKTFAFVVGAFFLVGGIAASRMIPAPTWFFVLDLVGAYIPMAWLATLMGGILKPDTPQP